MDHNHNHDDSYGRAPAGSGSAGPAYHPGDGDGAAPVNPVNGGGPPANPRINGAGPAIPRRRPSHPPAGGTGTGTGTGGGASKSRHSTHKVCGKCNEALTGQVVRALEKTFHLDCFTCNDCGKVVASKFFPVPDTPPYQYPLCETDYFRRLGLLCHECGGALRGSYITALDRKYHIDHFTCSICPTVFGAADSYYEHGGRIFCHYHYSTRFAQQCHGCQTAILKQFVEIFRNGANQHWHPECYMIHKYWNVRLASPGQAVQAAGAISAAGDATLAAAADASDPARSDPAGLETSADASDAERQRVRELEDKIEDKVLWIWRTLSAYEEKSAGCISDMLLHVSNGAYVDGAMAARRFILHVELLFAAADGLDGLMTAQLPKGLAYSREAKLLCKKVVAFFQLLAESQDTGVRRLGVTQELLALVTGLAHYLKLLIRICLQGALRLERDAGSELGLQQFLDTINSLDTKLGPEPGDLSGQAFVGQTADTCPVCGTSVEDRCFRHGRYVLHAACLHCASCEKDISDPAASAAAGWHEAERRVLCGGCASQQPGVELGFSPVTRLEQFAHLLHVAHARLLATLRTSGALPHTSDDPNLAEYDSSDGHWTSNSSTTGAAGPGPPLLRPDTRSKSYAGPSSAVDETATSSYEQALGNIRRLRSQRMDKDLSTAITRARTSRVVANGDLSGDGRQPLPSQREESYEPGPLDFGQDKLQLDDISRLVHAQQAQDQRPNANKYARGGLVRADPQPIVKSPGRPHSGGHEGDKLGLDGGQAKKYFCELTALEYFIVRHVAVLSMEPLLEGHFNQEELLDLIEMRKPTFWNKFGKVFGKVENKGGRKRGVFGVALDQLVERDGTESSDGVGPSPLRIPTVVDDALKAMRTMDMSMEGVFRKNGNIRRLKEMAEAIDTKGGDAVDLNGETPVQVAALLKKFLRELPDPVLTYKLHRLWLTSQKLQDEEKRRRVMHLACCLLPKANRDTMEVLFHFLKWVASFCEVDEESGSKMDIHNLATVIAPNILFSTGKVEGMEDSFLAIEAVHSLLLANEAMCEVPEDLQSILNDSTLFSSNADITTKEILKRYGDLAKGGAPVPAPAGHTGLEMSSFAHRVDPNTDILRPSTDLPRPQVPQGGSQGSGFGPGSPYAPPVQAVQGPSTGVGAGDGYFGVGENGGRAYNR